MNDTDSLQSIHPLLLLRLKKLSFLTLYEEDLLSSLPLRQPIHMENLTSRFEDTKLFN